MLTICRVTFYNQATDTMARFAYNIDSALIALLRENHLVGNAPIDPREAAAFLDITVPTPCKQGAHCCFDDCCGFVHPGEEGIGLKYLPEREYMDFQTGKISNDKAAIQMVNALGKRADFYLRTAHMISWEDWCFIKKIPYIPVAASSHPSVPEEEAMITAHWDAFRGAGHMEVLASLAERPPHNSQGPVKPELYNKVHAIVEQIKSALVESGWRILNRANRIPKNLTSILTQEFMDLTTEDLYKIVTDDSLLTKKVLDGVEAYWLQPTAYTFATH